MGKTFKDRNSDNFRKGQKCPNCGKGKLEKAKKVQRVLVCKTCKSDYPGGS